MEQQKFDIESLPLSASVRGANRHFSTNKLISAWAIVSEILKSHPEYANHMGEKIQKEIGPTKSDPRILDDWFNSLSRLFDLDMVRQKVKWINGQLTIWGLAQLDPELKLYLNSFGFLTVLEDEYKDEKRIHPSDLLQRSSSAKQNSSFGVEAQSDTLNQLRIARAISDNLGRAKALIQLLPDLPEDVRAEAALDALGATRRIDSMASRISALNQVLPYLPDDIRANAAMDAFSATSNISDPVTRFAALNTIAQYLPEVLQRQIGESVSTQVENNITDSTEVNPPPTSKRSPLYSPPVAGYISDRIDQESPDLLNIEREVANIANVLTFKQVHPPLALGLFGDWGSGKTFFMGKLYKYVGQIADHYHKYEQTNNAEAMWCSRVAQIEFNAWHFSDSNLWASLVTRIYEGLDRELNKEKETADEIKKKIIEAQIKEAKEKSVKTESQLDQAITQVSRAEENLKEKKKEREGKENKLQGLISSIPDLLKETALAEPLQKAASALGVPEASQSYDALEELDGQLKDLRGRLTAVTTSLLYSPRTLGLMAVFLVILPILLTLIIEYWGGWLTEAGKRVAEISTFLTLIVGWLQAQVRRGLGLVANVESAFKRAREIRQTRIETNEDVIQARKELIAAQAKEQAARANLEVVKTELQRLQDELQELRPERKLQRLIESRAGTSAYAQHLGIVSLIRSDFENMSRILGEMVDERRDFKTTPPIQRIILYIDDLDRCKPERVVEVLEAIHLLLFFQLFVVVVAVDPRWLRHSLAQHYPATLNERGGMRWLDNHSGMSLYSTPQDYLEKIFQIPFALRPVEKGGYQSLVDDLLKPLPTKERQKEPEPQPSPTTAESDVEMTIKTDQSVLREIEPSNDPEAPTFESSEQEGHKVEQKEVAPEPPFTPIPPRQLEFTEWEKEDIQRLWLMFRTPRTVKRFINIYRLLRAGLVSAEDVKSFEGTKRKPGEYQVAILLLASITAFPNEASRLLYQLDAWLDIQELKTKKGGYNWRELIEFLKKAPDLGWESANRESTPQERYWVKEDGEEFDPSNSKVTDTETSNNARDEMNFWNLLLDCLDQVTQDNTWKKPFKLKTLRFWVMRVARFSFSVQPT